MPIDFATLLPSELQQPFTNLLKLSRSVNATCNL